jgi:hypothetical protein
VTPLPSHVLGLHEQALKLLQERLDALVAMPSPLTIAQAARAGAAVIATGEAVILAGRGEDPP